MQELAGFRCSSVDRSDRPDAAGCWIDALVKEHSGRNDSRMNSGNLPALRDFNLHNTIGTPSNSFYPFQEQRKVPKNSLRRLKHKQAFLHTEIVVRRNLRVEMGSRQC